MLLFPTITQFKNWTLPNKIGFIGGWLAAIALALFVLELTFLSPTVSVFTENSFQDSDHFNKPFIISNDSPYKIHSVEISAYFPSIRTNNIIITDVGFTFEDQVAALRKKEKHTIRIPFSSITSGYVINADSLVYVDVLIEYRIPLWLFNFKKSQNFSYKVTADEGGKTYWEAIAAEK